MPNNLKSLLNKIDSLENLNNFIDILQAKEIGLFGGRKFIQKNISLQYLEGYGKNGELSLNDIVRKFDDLRDEIATKGQVTLEIRRKIHQRDEEANDKLEKTNIFTRILTAFRSTFGSSSRKREKVLLELAKTLPKVQQRQYLVEEIFDELSPRIKKWVPNTNTEALKTAIVDYAKGQENDEVLVKAVKNFLTINRIKHKGLYSSAEFQENFLKYLIYTYRHTMGDKRINADLPALLLAAFAIGKKYTSGFSEVAHPFRSFRLYTTFGAPWIPIIDDQHLITIAETKFKSIKKED